MHSNVGRAEIRDGREAYDPWRCLQTSSIPQVLGCCIILHNLVLNVPQLLAEGLLWVPASQPNRAHCWNLFSNSQRAFSLHRLHSTSPTPSCSCFWAGGCGYKTPGPPLGCCRRQCCGEGTSVPATSLSHWLVWDAELVVSQLRYTSFWPCCI